MQVPNHTVEYHLDIRSLGLSHANCMPHLQLTRPRKSKRVPASQNDSELKHYFLVFAFKYSYFYKKYSIIKTYYPKYSYSNLLLTQYSIFWFYPQYSIHKIINFTRFFYLLYTYVSNICPYLFVPDLITTADITTTTSP